MLLSFVVAFVPAIAAEAVRVASPDGAIEFRLSTGAERSLTYSVSRKGTVFILPSPIGIMVDQLNLALSAEIGRVERYEVDESYPWYGAHSVAKEVAPNGNVSLRAAVGNR